MRIEIPFQQGFREVMLNGEKTWTSRTKRYGDIGDVFEVFEQKFEIVGILKLPLSEVVDLHYEEEGFPNKIGLILLWVRLHPRKGYVPSQKVWVHVFKKVD